MGRGAAGHETHEAGGTSTGEGPPASFLPKNPPGLALARGGVDATVHHAALHLLQAHAALTLQTAIDFSPMTNSENLNNNLTVINGVQNAVIPYSCPVPFFAL